MIECTGHVLAPDLAMGVVSISPVCGCTGGCKYCYLPLKAYAQPGMNAFGLEQTIAWLRAHPDFAAGQEGNILCIGSWGEVFPRSKTMRQEVFEWLQRLLALENPMAIVTKADLSAREVALLCSLQAYPHQILFMESLTSLRWAPAIEPGCSAPEQRFQTLHRCRQQGLCAAVLINPYLRGITDPELDELFGRCRACGVEDVVVSPLFFNEHIIRELAQCAPLQPIARRAANVTASATRGLQTQNGHMPADDIAEAYPTIDRAAENYGLRVFYHYQCVLSRQYGRLNATFWNTPAICRHCGHCAKWANA